MFSCMLNWLNTAFLGHKVRLHQVIYRILDAPFYLQNKKTTTPNWTINERCWNGINLRPGSETIIVKVKLTL